MTENGKKAFERYEKAMAGLKQGINILFQEQPSQRVSGEGSPKELRYEDIRRMISNSALAKLLIEAGIIKETDYLNYCADAAEAEMENFEVRLSKILGGRSVKL